MEWFQLLTLTDVEFNNENNVIIYKLAQDFEKLECNSQSSSSSGVDDCQHVSYNFYIN